MTPSPMNAGPRAAPNPAGALAKALLLSLALAPAGCAQFARDTQDLARQVQVATCISRCQTVKDQCNDDARFDYHQCEASYQAAQRNYRWCNAASDERCGYPWWSCSENLYGYCTNRYWECHNACRRTRRG